MEFWAPDCIFSRLLLPVRVRMKPHAPQLRLLCCNVGSVAVGAAEFGAEALPALILFNGAKRVRTWLGAVDATLIEHTLRRALSDPRA